MTQPIDFPGGPARERPLGELVGELWENTEKLLRQEFSLAAAELDQRIDNAKS